MIGEGKGAYLIEDITYSTEADEEGTDSAKNSRASTPAKRDSAKAGTRGLVICVPVGDTLEHALRVDQKLVAGSLGIMAGFVILLFIILYKKLLVPVNLICDAHRKVESGDADYRLPESAASYEFTQINRSFNRMMDAMHQLRIEKYENELKRQQMQMQNLQLQIHPHFLQNMFSLMYVLASRKDDSILQVILYLSGYFRNVFRDGSRLIMMNRELELIEGYIRIAKVRYENQVEYTADLDPELYVVRVPPLLLHTLIENSIRHGYCHGRALHIMLEGRYDDGLVTIAISDDGRGFKKESLETVQGMLSGTLSDTDSNEHMGLRNSFKRLRYSYGEKAGMRVSSEPDALTMVTVWFPYDLEEEDDEPSDGK